MTTLANALAKHMEHELTKFSYLTALLDEEGMKYDILPSNSKISILVSAKNQSKMTFRIETSDKGYILFPVYTTTEHLHKVALKKIERVYAETIIDNIHRISNNYLKEMFKHFREEEAWMKRRKLLHKKEYLNDLKHGVVV
ncbi:hypothetical protein ACO1DI_12415 [Priestia sp. 40]|uniref:hypothetical protein n=1 Tax=Priestia sp. 40 TaxID=3394459 RepID=UPI003BF6A474